MRRLSKEEEFNILAKSSYWTRSPCNYSENAWSVYNHIQGYGCWQSDGCPRVSMNIVLDA